MRSPVDSEEQKRREQQKQAELRKRLEHPDALDELVLYTLNNFSYRYFDDAPKAEIRGPGHYCIEHIEVGIKEAIKSSNPVLRAGLKKLVMEVPKSEGPTVMRRLSVEHQEGQPQVTKVRALISWGHPDHCLVEGSFIEDISEIRSEDFLELRNSLAFHLEKVCELFS